MPNFWSNFLPFTKRSGLCFSPVGGGGTLTFFKDAKFLVNFFSLYQALWTLFFSSGGGGGGVEGGVVQTLTFFKDAKFWSNFFPFTKHSGLCFSPVEGRGGGGRNLRKLPFDASAVNILVFVNASPPLWSILQKEILHEKPIN